MKNIITVIWDYDKTLVDDICKIQSLRNITLILQLFGRMLTHCLTGVCGNKM